MKKQFMTKEETILVNDKIKSRIIAEGVTDSKEYERITNQEVLNFLKTKYPKGKFGICVKTNTIH